jgi:hypothetical protein
MYIYTNTYDISIIGIIIYQITFSAPKKYKENEILDIIINKMDEDIAHVLSNLVNHNVAYNTRNICLIKINTKEMNDLRWLLYIDQNQIIVLE